MNVRIGKHVYYAEELTPGRCDLCDFYKATQVIEWYVELVEPKRDFNDKSHSRALLYLKLFVL